MSAARDGLFHAANYAATVSDEVAVRSPSVHSRWFAVIENHRTELLPASSLPPTDTFSAEPVRLRLYRPEELQSTNDGASNQFNTSTPITPRNGHGILPITGESRTIVQQRGCNLSLRRQSRNSPPYFYRRSRGAEGSTPEVINSK